MDRFKREFLASLPRRTEAIQKLQDEIKAIEEGPATVTFFGMETDPRIEIPLMQEHIAKLEGMTDADYLAMMDANYDREVAEEAEAVRPL